MATIPRIRAKREVDYPTSDGRAMDSDIHRQDMWDLIATLQRHFAADPNVYVSGNLLLFYEEGNRRRYVSPDVFVVRGIPKGLRDYYLLWKEGKSPDVVIEITSKRTRREDQHKKWLLYRDVLKIPEYFLFDPREEYLKPSLQGHRFENGEYLPIAMVAGRMPSEVLGLDLGREGHELRLFVPQTYRRLSTLEEDIAVSRAQIAEAKQRISAAQIDAAQAERAAEATRRALEIEAENWRLRAQIEQLLREADERRRSS